MPSVTTVGNLVLSDGTANRTFQPREAAIDRTVYLDRGTSIPASNRIMVLKMDPAKNTRPTHKVDVQFVYPKEAIVNGVPTVISTARKTVSYSLPEDFTDAERTAFFTLANNAEVNANVAGYVKTLDAIF